MNFFICFKAKTKIDMFIIEEFFKLFLFINVFSLWNGMMNQQKNKQQLNHLLQWPMTLVHKILKSKRIFWLVVLKKMNGTRFYEWGNKELDLAAVHYYNLNFAAIYRRKSLVKRGEVKKSVVMAISFWEMIYSVLDGRNIKTRRKEFLVEGSTKRKLSTGMNMLYTPLWSFEWSTGIFIFGYNLIIYHVCKSMLFISVLND